MYFLPATSLVISITYRISLLVLEYYLWYTANTLQYISFEHSFN